MTRTILEKSQQIQVIPYETPPRRQPLIPLAEADVQLRRSRGWAYASGALGIGLLLAVTILGARVWMEQHHAESLAGELAALERMRERDSEAWRHSATALQRQLEFQNQQLEALHAERQKLEQELVRAVTSRSAPAAKPRAVTPAIPVSSETTPPPSGAKQELAAATDPVEASGNPPAESGEPEVSTPELRRAMEAAKGLRQATVAEAPTLEDIRMHIKAGDPAVVSNKEQAKADRSRLARVFTHPIFIDSAVLAGSLLVPPSLPLTLAQSRLGRTLTRRALKETDSDKTVAGKVAQDLGNMPITRKKKKK